MINAPFTHCAGCCNYYNGICNSLDKCPYQVAETYKPLSKEDLVKIDMGFLRDTMERAKENAREKEIAREIFARIEQQTYDRRYDAKAILKEVKFYELAKEYGVEVEDD